jgi:hypothetical protein
MAATKTLTKNDRIAAGVVMVVNAQQKIAELFTGNVTVRLWPTKKDGCPAVSVNVTGSNIEFKTGFLNGLIAMSKLLGVDDVDIPSHVHHRGCETCDFGGSDEWEFLGWKQ